MSIVQTRSGPIMDPLMRSRWIRLLALAVLFPLTGCARFVDQDQTVIMPGAVAVLAPGMITYRSA